MTGLPAWVDTVTFRAPCPCGAVAVWVATRADSDVNRTAGPPATQVRCPTHPPKEHP